MRLVVASEMREIDHHAIEIMGIPSLVLMENAGLKTLMTIEKAFSGLQDKRFTIVCGKGNNGGDGLVIARHLFNNRVALDVFVLSEPDALSIDAKTNLKILQKSGFNPIFVTTQEDLDELRVALEFSNIVIDAIFGTGFSGQIQGIACEAVEIINESRAKVVSLDIPSGICATTGHVSQPSIRADVTVTFGLPKVGLYLYPGCEFTGEVWIGDIGIPNVSTESISGSTFLLTTQMASSLLPARSDFSHKGAFGHLLILAGSTNYHGAGVLCTYGALRSGAGLVTLGIPEAISEKFLCDILPETIIKSFPSDREGFAINENHVNDLSGRYRAIVAGPGWGGGGKRRCSVTALLKNWCGPLLLDADALNAIEDPSIFSDFKGELIITPHPGEMAKLTGKNISAILEDPVQIAREFVSKFPCRLVLKGATTVIAFPDSRIILCSRPNSGLARGGSGDLLAGLIGGLMTQGLSSQTATIVGTFLHSEAASIAREEIGADSMTVSEIASKLPKAFKNLRGVIPSRVP
ncbi:MAG: NAD(P)H-hydrate dehydratase [Candidatus Riflebacteria bacterium]|nr:NAD(P)H-hydrate dehydratase [Candidatus Riflebacteria bacterium]